MLQVAQSGPGAGEVSGRGFNGLSSPVGSGLHVSGQFGERWPDAREGVTWGAVKSPKPTCVESSETLTSLRSAGLIYV